jgi:hypothetical protein
MILEFLALKRKQLHDESDFAALQARCATRFLELNAYVEAEPILRECLATRTRLHADEWSTFNTESLLGGALLGLKRLTEAEPLLLSGYQGMKDRESQISPQGMIRVAEAAERLSQFYETTEQADKAAHWRKIATVNTPSQ